MRRLRGCTGIYMFPTQCCYKLHNSQYFTESWIGGFFPVCDFFTKNSQHIIPLLTKEEEEDENSSMDPLFPLRGDPQQRLALAHDE
jgi:hypothetical protein